MALAVTLHMQFYGMLYLVPADGDGEGALLLLLFFFSSFSLASFSMVEIYWFFSPYNSIKSHLFPFLEVEFFSKHWLWKSDAGFIGFEEGSETCVCVCVCVCPSLFFSIPGEEEEEQGRSSNSGTLSIWPANFAALPGF
jgi:hypothetical protein